MSGLIIVGAGPGLGLAIAQRFATTGMPVALIARSAGVTDLAERTGPTARGYQADVTDEKSLTTTLDAIIADQGVPDALVYNAAIIQRDNPGELTPEAHLQAWSVNVLGALITTRHLTPAMLTRGSGTIILTGGMPAPDPRYTSLSLGKADIRALTTILHEAYAPQGLHTATVTIDCHMVPGTDSDPTLIAEHYWNLHRQPPEAWALEIVHHGTTQV
ncbi:SDR family NAD(P)-dependent oxidoreductase [Nocardia sp. NPDC020380]|uniref:SDR family NAD(P)-dependent oxidoreductase n=1 Tax=Nocardia sp. NPDC020380 TaxID=3364309 RepID=UPI00379C43EA